MTFFDPQIEALTRKAVERRIAVALAGRAAEEVMLGDVTAGAGGSGAPTSALPTTWPSARSPDGGFRYPID